MFHTASDKVTLITPIFICILKVTDTNLNYLYKFLFKFLVYLNSKARSITQKTLISIFIIGFTFSNGRLKVNLCSMTDFSLSII